MVDSVVLVFPGQGAQVIGMGRDVAEALPEARALFQRADDLLGIPLTRIIFEGPEAALIDTSIQQPALVLVGLVIKKALEIKRGRPLNCVAAAGLSLGEYTALSAVGALTFDEAVRLAHRRGELMKLASQQIPCGMAVVLNLDAEKIKNACAQAAREMNNIVSISNFNGGGQIVIGGENAALTKAMELCKAAGAKRVLKLPVAGAFHTALMQPAADAFAAELDRVQFSTATAPVYANVTAAPVKTSTEIREALKQQIVNPVLWEQTVKNLMSDGHKKFLELGPGSTVSNMIRRIAPEAECQAITTWAEALAFSS
ncbi:MAG: ACP S-malonyltransferase [Planctomycetota bacterium]